MKGIFACAALACAVAMASGTKIGFGDGPEEGCQIPGEPLQTIYDNADYNSELVQMIVVAVVSSLWSIVVVYFHLTNPPHVKNCLLWDKIISIRMHVTSGVTEIVTAHIAWFAEDHDVWAQVMGIASCFHLCTAMYQTPDVFGIKALMIPAYIICIILRWWTTIDLLLNPTCYYKIMREYICLSIYTWCRLYFVVFFTMRIFEHNRYTISIVLAGFTCAPSCGPAFNLGIAMFAFGYLILVGFCFGEENKAWQLTETSGSMFKNPTFRGFLMAAKTMQVAEHHADESESDTPQTRIARLLFQQFDKDKSGMLDYYEMSTLGATFGSGVLHDKVESYLKRHPASAHDGLDFEAFRKLLFPGQGFFVDLDTYDAAARSERSQAKLIFDGITVVGGTDYVTVEEMQSLFIEWGVPRREAMRMFVMADKDGSGEIDFEEFFKYMKPVWKYQFKELRGTLAEFEHIEHRKKVLKAFEHSKLPKTQRTIKREAQSVASFAANAEITALKARLAELNGVAAPATPFSLRATPPVVSKPATTPRGTHQSSEI